MHIVFAASECVPYAKTGGLADVVGALPSELVRQGHQVTVYLPLYRGVLARIADAKIVLRGLTIPFASYNRFVSIVDGGLHNGVQMYFVDCPEMFDRAALYGTATADYPDNAERFGLFSRAVLEASKQLGVPDVFHVHDWQASLLPVFLQTIYYFDPILNKVPCVLTVHNAGYQGWFPPRTTELLLLPWDIFTMDRLEHFDSFNFLKGGIVYSDAITTVSRKYAEEIQTPAFGFGLETIFARRAADLRGILNGVDYSEWDPATDAHLPATYTPQQLAGKQTCRRDLLQAYGLGTVPDTTPVVGIVSRFATQKGFDLIAAIANQLALEDMVLVVLGSGEARYETLFLELMAKFPGKIATQVKYDNALAHKIEAGSDIFLMPSRYEPCGLNQIYSLKYGTPPVVRATGGLDDTIEEWDAAAGTGTGFKFSSVEPLDLLATLRRALTAFQNKTAWRKLMRNGMAQNYSWEKPAQEYIALYEEVVRRRSL